ncbi:actin cytoskeleton-regulatory complex protein pan1-like [Ceratina calcarata]|uniref:Actin cytoskeleton-regulatory complex protein pan1-like n=1 Tax=Ceratina calcarata TaxID=156304 RepID=A0AAJ7J5T4_9HYME|nr:actin cytoskeleton-regulatory complex protein pan1-like [Ceratina calcarata]
MSAAVQPVPTLPSGGPPPHNPLHHTAGGLTLPPLGSAPVMMPRPPASTIPPLGPSLPPPHQDAADLAEAAPNQDVLLALLARNKNLEERKIKTPSCFPIKEEHQLNFDR